MTKRAKDDPAAVKLWNQWSAVPLSGQSNSIGSIMMNPLLRCLSCLAFLAVISVPAHGEQIRYTEMPEELFVPKTNPQRDTAANVMVVEREVEEPTRIMSHGRQVRVVGVPFMPELEDSIDFRVATESTWWSALVGYSLVAWLAPVEEAPAVASSDVSPRYANLETATEFVLE